MTPAVAYVRKIDQHLRWIRTEGLARLIEEDQLDPRQRVGAWSARRRWRRVHGIAPGTATPVFIVGVQRSGTNMLARGFEANPAVEVHNENDRSAFRQYRLRDERTIGAIVNASRHRYVLFKPLCDSGRIAAVIDRLPVVSRSRAIWAWRDVDDRARSAVAKFGDANRRALQQIASGTAGTSWQAVGLSESSLSLIKEFDYSTMEPHEAACLFWYVRNAMLFEQGLDQRPDFLVSSYSTLVADPERTIRAVCEFVGLRWSPDMTAGIERRTPRDRNPLPVSSRIRELCDELTDSLEQASIR
jgi:hypothetical protein